MSIPVLKRSGDRARKERGVPKWMKRSGSPSFQCPQCGQRRTAVKDTRPTEQGHVRRRRVCLSCEARFTTFEVLATDLEAAAASEIE